MAMLIQMHTTNGAITGPCIAPATMATGNMSKFSGGGTIVMHVSANTPAPIVPLASR